jgi:hypothetical protein
VFVLEPAIPPFTAPLGEFFKLAKSLKTPSQNPRTVLERFWSGLRGLVYHAACGNVHTCRSATSRTRRQRPPEQLHWPQWRVGRATDTQPSDATKVCFSKLKSL